MQLTFFDLETKNLFKDIDPDFNKKSNSTKEQLKTKLLPKLGLATACIIIDESPAKIFDEGKEQDLIEALNSSDKIIGHNILNFDYHILSSYFKGDIIANYASKTLDTFEELKKTTNGHWIGLDDLAQLNLGKKKTENSEKIPEMWRTGKKQEVREYCKNDVQILKEIYYFGKETGKLKYTKKDYGTPIGIEEAEVPWK